MQESFFGAVCSAALEQFLSKSSAESTESLVKLMGEMIQRLEIISKGVVQYKS